ncbi:MAG: type II toxin-antitoxin system VapC family toxin [Chloroflexi bacterium]|nr:type II toxin-antitoxin system VapC family toxin [Chloroflexota bacterium]
MTIFLDSSALAKRYIAEPGSPRVLAIMAADTAWAASALALPETKRALCRSVSTADALVSREAALRADWKAFDVIDVDADLLKRAAEIACTQGTRTLDSIHLAAAERLGPELTFVTFDARQAAAARAMGLVVAP